MPLPSTAGKGTEDEKVFETHPQQIPVPTKLLRTQVVSRPPPVEGDNVYAMRTSLLTAWLKAKVIKKIPNSATNEMDYLIQYEQITKTETPVDPPVEIKKGCVFGRQVSLKELAYSIPSPLQLPVGARVVAEFKEEQLSANVENGKFYVGIVAEPPKTLTNNRYLIFFDFGGAQYVSHDSVFLVCASSPTVWRDVHPNVYDFIYKYIREYPGWPLARLQVDSLISVEWNGFILVARVLEIDCALVKVQFENDDRIEWIFRGSNRLLQKNDRDLLTGYMGSIKEVKVPSNVPRPREYIPHKCSPDCVKKYIPNAELNKLSPLAIPLFLGWSREVGGPKEGPKCDRHLKEVHYVAPCGVKLAEPHDVREYLRITDFNLTMDFFYLKSDVNVLAEFMPTRVLLKTDDLSNGKELRPVQVVNCLDHEPLPHFEYIVKTAASLEMNIATISESQKCCDCTDNCMTPSQCACVKMTQERLALRNVTVFTYNNRRLDDYIRGGIVECNKGCPCKKDCPTRVVQAGSMWPLQIFNTGVKGWGVRALHDMPAGSFLGTYAGELINSKEAELRTDQDGSTYMANLDYVPIQPGDKRKIYSSPKAYSDKYTDDCFVVDSRFKGNVVRFYNHSCNPNVVMQNVFIDTHDIRFPQLAFFTIKVVKAGSELVFNYNYDIKKNKGDPLYCSCLTPYCKVRLL